MKAMKTTVEASREDWVRREGSDNVNPAKPDPQSARPDVFLFEDFRAFLREYFQWLQTSDPGLSHRKLAKAAGYANPGYFNDIVNARRKVGAAGLERYARALALNHGETEFLVCLLAFQEAEDDITREVAYDAVLRRRNRRFFKRLGHNQSKYYIDFNYPLIRAAIEVCDFRGDYKVLGDFLHPNMSADSVKRYVRDLCEWGMVEQSKDGRYQVAHSYIEPPSGQRFAMSKMFQAWQSQTATVLGAMSPQKVHVSTAIVTVSEGTYKAIQRHIGKFRDEILGMVKEDQGADRVASFSIQLLPRGESESKANPNAKRGRAV